MNLPSPYAVAMLTIINLKKYADEKGKPVTKVRLSRSTLSSISKRKIFRTAFISELTEYLESLGWIFIELPDGGFSILESDSVSSWIQISSSRIKKEISDLSSGIISEEDLENQIDLDEEDD